MLRYGCLYVLAALMLSASSTTIAAQAPSGSDATEEPSAEQPGKGKPGTARPGSGQPGAGQPGAGQPGAGQPSGQPQPTPRAPGKPRAPDAGSAASPAAPASPAAAGGASGAEASAAGAQKPTDATSEVSASEQADATSGATDAESPDAVSGATSEPPDAVSGASEAEGLETPMPLPKNWFVAEDGTIADADQAYELRLSMMKPNHWRPLLAEAIIMGIGNIWYWSDPSNEVDWDLDSWGQRFMAGTYRYDNNHFRINWTGHPLTGSSFYVMARSNDLTMPVALTYAFMTSWAWEFVFEFYEKVSINDTIVTPWAGMVLGEFIYRVGYYVNSALQPTPLHRTLSWIFGFPIAIHRAIEDLPPAEAWSNSVGFGASTWHDLSVASGVTLKSNGFAAAEITLDGEMVAIPSYMRVGRDRRLLHDGDFTSLSLQFGIGGGGGGGGVQLEADAMLLGYFDQQIVKTDGHLYGHALAVGTNGGFFMRQEEYADWSERLGMVGLPGGSLELRVQHADMQFRLGLRAYPVFATTFAPTYPAWQEANPGAIPKSVLTKESDYLAWGAWGRLRLDAIWPDITLSLRVNADILDSSEGLDRFEERVTQDPNGISRHLGVLGRIRLTPFPHGIFVQTHAHIQRRWNDLDGFKENRAIFGAGLQVGIKH